MDEQGETMTMSNVNDWRQAEVSGRRRARECGERADQELAKSAIATREWAEAEAAALTAASIAQDARIELERWHMEMAETNDP